MEHAVLFSRTHAGIHRGVYRAVGVWLVGVGLYAGDFVIKLLPLWYRPVNVVCGLDAFIPFDPRWSWAYLFAWLFFVFGAAGWYAWENRIAWTPVRQLLYAVLFMQVGAWIIHLLVPTYMPRPELVLEEQSLSVWLMQHIFAADPPTHVLPSLHVASVTVVAWFFQRHRGEWRLWFGGGIVVLVMLSVLFTKQHGVLDVLAGLLWARLSCYAGCRLGAPVVGFFGQEDVTPGPVDARVEDALPVR